jgi:hypothetical protein
MIWEVKYAGMMTQPMPIMIDEMLIKREIRMRKVDNIKKKIDGFSLVFYSITLKTGWVSK